MVKGTQILSSSEDITSQTKKTFWVTVSACEKFGSITGNNCKDLERFQKWQNFLWMPLEAFNFKNSHLKHKEAQRGQTENGYILGLCVCFDSLWKIITLLGINSDFSFLRILKTVHTVDAGKMGIWPLVLC